MTRRLLPEAKRISQVVFEIDHQFEQRLLQIVVAFAWAVPLGGGLLGVSSGAAMLDHSGDATLHSHLRYLSDLLLGIGFCFASTIPRIDQKCKTTTIHSAIVDLGGLARLFGVLIDGWPDPTMMFALSMELGVVPL